jgi:hypothetical protein
MGFYIPAPEGVASIGVAPGGLGNQILRKASDLNYDTEWVDPEVGNGTQGPAGPAGPVGPAGVGTFYVHTQASAATTWTINHNLGYRPTVELLDSGSQEIDGDIAHPTVNQTIVTLNPATAGLARLI